MTNTEFLCLRLSANIKTQAEFKARRDISEIFGITGLLTSEEHTALRQRIQGRYEEKLLQDAEKIMEKVVREFVNKVKRHDN